ncbi:MAG: DUF3465 domain-containing protein [Pseudomonadota bacterium]
MKIKQSTIGVFLIIAVLYVLNETSLTTGGAEDSLNSTTNSTSRSASGSNDAIVRAFNNRTSDVWVNGEGVVSAILPDDNKGSRHQKFILNLGDGLTVLVAHNIDLAPRIQNLKKHDQVAFRGEYEWNHKGGVVHWTHHDPAGRREGGFLRHLGRLYK